MKQITKETIYDRNEFKLIDRVCQLREIYSNLKVGEIRRPLIIGNIQDGVFEVEVEF